MNEEEKASLIIWICAILFGIFLILIMMWGLPQYKVWQKELSGKAQLKEAEWSRQTKVEEARAEMEASKLLREAEVERARGAAEAMEIIQSGITDEYLRYLAIQAQEKMADSPNHTTTFIPSGNLGVPLIKTLE